MKNIETILNEAGLTLTEEQRNEINQSVIENYKTINDYQRQVDKITNLTSQLETATTTLKKFEDVDPEVLNEKIQQLETELGIKDSEYQKQIADRDFEDLLKESIAKVSGINPKAISALLDLENLKASKNQKEDIAAALKVLTEAEDSKMLFKKEETIFDRGDPIGVVTKGKENKEINLRDALSEKYSK